MVCVVALCVCVRGRGEGGMSACVRSYSLHGGAEGGPAVGAEGGPAVGAEGGPAVGAEGGPAVGAEGGPAVGASTHCRPANRPALCWLACSPDEDLRLDEWVLNTEAHPLRVMKAGDGGGFHVSISE
jgi:hypothetical protein